MVAWTFLVMSIPWVISNDVRPLYPLGIWPIYHTPTPSIFSRSRTHMYFNSYEAGFADYTQAIDFLAAQNPKVVGLLVNSRNPGGYPYPIDVLLQERLGQRPRLEYVRVTNVSGKLRDGTHAPPLIFSTSGSLSTFAGERYHVVLNYPSVTVLATTKVANEVWEGWKGVINTKNLLIRSNLEVYLDRNRNRLVYVKNRCQPATVVSAPSHQLPAEPSIFLHVTPADVDDLPDHRKRYEFENLDFPFNAYRLNIQLGERCIAVRRLPAYAVDLIYTGEHTDEGPLWEARVSFNE